MSIVTARLEKLVKQQILFFSILVSNGNKSYLAITKSSFFIVDRSVRYQQKYFFAWMKELIVDNEDPALFKITFQKGRPALFLEATNRAEIIAQLQIYWKTESMIRTNHVAPFPWKMEALTYANKNLNQSAFTKPPAKMYLSEMGDYGSWIPEYLVKTDEEPEIFTLPPLPGVTGPPSIHSIQYFQFNQEYVEKKKIPDAKPLPPSSIQSEDETNTVQTEESFLESISGTGDATICVVIYKSAQIDHSKPANPLRLICESTCRELLKTSCEKQRKPGHVIQSCVFSSAGYRKKMNLTNDPAAWNGWHCTIQNEYRTVAIIALRRAFIPAFGDQYQDILCYHIGTIGKPKSTLSKLVISKIADSFYPLNPNFFYDDLVVTTRANALLFDEKSYHWFRTQRVIEPRWSSVAHAFTKSVIALLERSKVPTMNANSLEPKATTVLNPFEIIHDLNIEIQLEIERYIKQLERQFNQKHPDHIFELDPDRRKLLRNQSIQWKRKVSRYFAWCLNAGFHTELNLENLSNWFFMKDPENKTQWLIKGSDRMILVKLFDYLCYIRHIRNDYDPWLTIFEKLENSTVLGEFISCNPIVLSLLLKVGYFYHICLGQISEPLHSQIFPLHSWEKSLARPNRYFSTQSDLPGTPFTFFKDFSVEPTQEIETSQVKPSPQATPSQPIGNEKSLNMLEDSDEDLDVSSKSPDSANPPQNSEISPLEKTPEELNQSKSTETAETSEATETSETSETSETTETSETSETTETTKTAETAETAETLQLQDANKVKDIPIVPKSMSETHRLSILITFYKKLLTGSPSSVVQEAVCERIALISTEDKARDVLVSHGVVQTLMILLLSDNQTVLRSCARALVNITANAPTAKEIVVNESIQSIATRHFHSGDENLILSFLMIIKHCLDTEQHRVQLCTPEFFSILFSLILPSKIPGHETSPKVVAASLACIWNSLRSEKIIDLVLAAGILKLLVRLIQKEKNSSVLSKAFGCFVVITTREKVLKDLERQTNLIGAIISRLAESNHPGLTRNVLGSLVNITNSRKLLEQIMHANILPLIQRNIDSNNAGVSKFAQMLKNQLV